MGSRRIRAYQELISQLEIPAAQKKWAARATASVLFAPSRPGSHVKPFPLQIAVASSRLPVPT
jgi:hypothetical protein